MTECTPIRLRPVIRAGGGLEEEAVNPSKPKYKNSTLYKQAGNSIPVPIFESMFDVMLNGGRRVWRMEDAV